ncbi:MAG: hypothetical protein LBR44_11310 [Clostridiales Family XIII bacterium]|jgi:hypothetical protein|nr:hypothetical protein [Clostridiales Family XIII bacterium]
MRKAKSIIVPLLIALVAMAALAGCGGQKDGASGSSGGSGAPGSSSEEGGSAPPSIVPSGMKKVFTETGSGLSIVVPADWVEASDTSNPINVSDPGGQVGILVSETASGLSSVEKYAQVLSETMGGSAQVEIRDAVVGADIPALQFEVDSEFAEQESFYLVTVFGGGDYIWAVDFYATKEAAGPEDAQEYLRSIEIPEAQ